jgi:hypothetical protein
MQGGTKTATTADACPGLSLSLYRVTFVARASLDLPAYLGSTLRGAFGHVFRAMACPGRIGEPCPIPQSCPYHLIFETSPPPGAGALRTHEEIPRPFVIAPITDGGWMEQGRRLIEPGGELSFHLTLIGRAQEFFPYFVVAFREIDRLGRRPGSHPRPHFSVGEGRVRVTDTFQAQPPPSTNSSLALTESGRREAISPSPLPPSRAVELRRIDLLDPLADASWQVYDARENLVRPIRKQLTLADCAPIPPPSSNRLTINFLTQTRLKHEGGFARVPEFHIVFRRLLGRLSSLSRFHGGTPLDVDFKGLIDRATDVRLIQNDTNWTRWQRYSSRQDRRMDWEGIVGIATYEGDLSQFQQLLKFGEFVHVGHGATFGLGKYGIVAA